MSKAKVAKCGITLVLGRTVGRQRAKQTSSVDNDDNDNNDDNDDDVSTILTSLDDTTTTSLVHPRSMPSDML